MMERVGKELERAFEYGDSWEMWIARVVDHKNCTLCSMHKSFGILLHKAFSAVQAVDFQELQSFLI
jgi:hypothetical protein